MERIKKGDEGKWRKDSEERKRKENGLSLRLGTGIERNSQRKIKSSFLIVRRETQGDLETAQD